MPDLRLAWRPPWSRPAALRTIRAVLVIPSLFALTFEGFGNLQMALFAAFGGFASLIFASFGGTWRDKLTAHLSLAIIGSVALIIGTAVHGITWLAVLVTIPVAFGIFFAGVAGPNAASGVTAALLPFVLPVATPGTISTVGDRLAGWWLASVVSTAAVLLLPAPSSGDRLRAAASGLACALASHLTALADGTVTAASAEGDAAAKHKLLNAFASTPTRPTGLATADQGMNSMAQLLDWCAVLVADATEEDGLAAAAPTDRDLLRLAATVLAQTADMLTASPRGAGRGAAGTDLPDPNTLERARQASAAYHRERADYSDQAQVEREARSAFHAQQISLAVQAVEADALIATGRADPDTIAVRRLGWYGIQATGTPAERRAAGLSGALGVMARHASFRSVWFTNSLRGSLALAAAVLVADVSGVQHGFWVVLGTMSVLRTNAASTESTALRALGGTALGFAVGALLLLGIGTSAPALWAALPIALAVAAYSPGTMPFAVGQAAFTVVVVVLFNLLQPADWKVGLLRIEDVAIGCLVSLVVGVLFWPRGAGGIVGDDLADAFRRGAIYLTQSVNWSLGIRQAPPDEGGPAVTAGLRLDEALRGYLTEQGTKKLSKDELWRLVMATTRLRLTAYSLAGRNAPQTFHERPHPGASYAKAVLIQQAAELSDFYDRIAVLVGRPTPREVLPPLTIPALTALGASTVVPDGDAAEEPVPDDLVRIITTPHHPHLLWVQEHLQHLSSHLSTITAPAEHVAEQRRLPWWR